MKLKEIEPLATKFIRASLKKGNPIGFYEPDELHVCDRSTAACVRLEYAEARALRDWLNAALGESPSADRNDGTDPLGWREQ